MVNVITDPECAGYSHEGHPEKPERIANTIKKLKEQTEMAIEWLAPGPCPDECILRAHIPDHLDRLQIPREFDSDTPYHNGILNFARASAGAALKALDIARAGGQVFSLMRPPGHHATAARAMGFCYLNNAAITALAALATGCKRVAVFDFDVHHGNGTEAILQDVEGASFYSVHQFPCYPGTGTRKVGANCFNYPMPPQTPRAEYRHALSDAIEEMSRFDPSVVVVSAGFDCFARDPLAQETLEIEDFQWLAASLSALSIPLVSLLEGGYSDELPELILAYLKGLKHTDVQISRS
jgi:acetoin utilization deacetylase AcuC-like enzyme